MVRIWMTAAAALAALLPAAADAQTAAEATLYNKGHFKGARISIDGPTRLQTPFVMKSVQIPAGTQWEFCSGKTFTGCRQVGQSVPAMVMNVRSARPVAGILPATAAPAGPAAPGQPLSGAPGQSLRGLASEYFVAPDAGGVRVEVQPGTAEAMSQRATQFCRSRGWRSSPHSRLQSVAGKFYLADVLCADTAN